MKIPDIDYAQVQLACGGDLNALDALIAAIQPGVYNLAVRMLGHREDARDATQEILLKVVTHLAKFRGEAAFSTWVYKIARNHLLTASTRARETPEVSLEALQEKLAQGLHYGASLTDMQSSEISITPEDKAAAREVALACTQGMLMAMDRDQRLAYLLDVVFGLSSQQAAQVLEVSPEAYRKRLSRARVQLDSFMGGTCGLVNQQAECRCEKQLPAIKFQRQLTQHEQADMPLLAEESAQIHLDRLFIMGEAAAVFRGHPDYQAPAAMTQAIREVLQFQGYFQA
jgi:RNA polymerase sigma factor (sigma-70 family)